MHNQYVLYWEVLESYRKNNGLFWIVRALSVNIVTSLAAILNIEALLARKVDIFRYLTILCPI
jgi:hypothetical protein